MKRAVQNSSSPENYFPLFEISAKSHYEFGIKIGAAAKVQIRQGLIRRKKWLAKLKKFADEKRAQRVAPFIHGLDQCFPEYLEELIGMAEGAGVDFDLLFILNLNPELNAMMLSAREENCSTVMSREGDHVILGHNEDGSEQYLGLMFLIDAELPSGNECFALCYPGIIPGNGPSINSHGMINTCNYIGGKDWRHGVPRYFINRAMLDARSMEDAVAIACHPLRAYPQAHNLISVREKQARMIESSVNKAVVKDVNGVVARANHYVFREMKSEPEHAPYLKRSGPRLLALSKELEKFAGGKITAGDIGLALSSHRGRPLSPCRHRNKKVGGATLGMFLFDSGTVGFRFYFGGPCRDIFKKFQPAWAR